MRVVDLADHVSAVSGIPLRTIVGPARTRDVVEARQVAQWLACRVDGHSTTQAGRAFGGMDHTTVMHACRRVDGELARGWGRRLDLVLDVIARLLARESIALKPRSDFAPMGVA